MWGIHDAASGFVRAVFHVITEEGKKVSDPVALDRMKDVRALHLLAPFIRLMLTNLFMRIRFGTRPKPLSSPSVHSPC